MKTLTLFLILSLLGISFFAFKCTNAGINDNIVTQERKVSGFNGIKVESGFNVTLRQGNTEKLVITAEENLMDDIVTEVRNGILIVKLEKNNFRSRGLHAQITVKDIKSIQVSGGGDITTETKLSLNNISINLSGGGNINADINATLLEPEVSGGGDAKFKGNFNSIKGKMSGGGDLSINGEIENLLYNISGGGDADISTSGKTKEANIKLSGGGDLKLNIDAAKLETNISGGGNADISGTASDFFTNMSGGGDLKAQNLVTERSEIVVSGGSNVEINANKELNVRASGGGDVSYSGNPAVTNFNTSGGSEIHKR